MAHMAWQKAIHISELLAKGRISYPFIGNNHNSNGTYLYR
ncbi:hypothetical protein RINTHM_4350 [Richelia intracellularis HM01]|nr:hypothetical protein RINTHM_4350 [Richelia intracellularis HM01]